VPLFFPYVSSTSEDIVTQRHIRNGIYVTSMLIRDVWKWRGQFNINPEQWFRKSIS